MQVGGSGAASQPDICGASPFKLAALSIQQREISPVSMATITGLVIHFALGANRPREKPALFPQPTGRKVTSSGTGRSSAVLPVRLRSSSAGDSLLLGGHTSAHRLPGTLELLNTQGSLLSGGGKILVIPPRKLGVDIVDDLMPFALCGGRTSPIFSYRGRLHPLSSPECLS